MDRIRRNIVFILLFLIAFGLLMLNSASLVIADHRFGDSSFFLRHQALRILIGLVLMVVVSQIDYHRYRRLAKPLLLVTIVLLVLLVLPFTTSIAPVIKRVRRWIIYPVAFQPSELAKMALVLWCATTILNKGPKIRNFKEGILPILCVLALIMVLIAFEPDLSTAVLCFVIVVVVLFLGEARTIHILSLVPIFGIGFLAVASLKGYQLDRVTALLHSGQGMLDENYQYNQSLIALGSGGWVGKGIRNGVQKYFFLPEPHTDFIFAVIGEEQGFIGTTGILFLFFLLGYCGYKIMMKCHDLFGFLLVGGVLALILVPVLFSVAINVGMLPAAGVGLSLISFGGSSIVTLLASFGIILNVANRTNAEVGRHRRKHK